MQLLINVPNSRLVIVEAPEGDLQQQEKNTENNWFGLFDLTLIPALIIHYMPCKVLDEITYPFPNFNGCTVEVWELISNFIPHFIMDVIT